MHTFFTRRRPRRRRRICNWSCQLICNRSCLQDRSTNHDILRQSSSALHEQNIICSKMHGPLLVGSYLKITWWTCGQWERRKNASKLAGAPSFLCFSVNLIGTKWEVLSWEAFLLEAHKNMGKVTCTVSTERWIGFNWLSLGLEQTCRSRILRQIPLKVRALSAKTIC